MNAHRETRLGGHTIISVAQMITIVDYNVGNLNSIANMLKRAGHSAILSSDIDEIRAASKLLLPGVGSFDSGMASIDELGLLDVLSHKVLEEQTPILGICLGMQLLLEGSEEGDLPGLGWIKGRCRRFSFSAENVELKIPHMGWNEARPTHRNSLFAKMDAEAGYYFVHSYHAVCDIEAEVLAHTTHGYSFVSAIERGNIYGTQFHPEKSHKHGMQLLDNFALL